MGPISETFVDPLSPAGSNDRAELKFRLGMGPREVHLFRHLVLRRNSVSLSKSVFDATQLYYVSRD